MYKTIAEFMSNERGATAIEYALIAAATGAALIVSMPTIGTAVQDLLTPLGVALAAIIG
ncbi:Flp family type IVb pilin [Anderseniella sp. Alg231-50]|uniref:Flp family type IVb pilin n=1 Tax=Anderseniella sp. Alg231-50 TaxID=1922226 RepID=UPI000D551803